MIILGHMYFLEDGVERNNQVTHNLGIIARAVNGAHQLIPSDSRPSIFWISHPQNTYDSNHAAGCERFGFWYAMPVHPTGPSYTENVWPRRTALKRFSNNVAHSCVDGLFIDDGENNGTSLGVVSLLSHLHSARREQRMDSLQKAESR